MSANRIKNKIKTLSWSLLSLSKCHYAYKTLTLCEGLASHNTHTRNTTLLSFPFTRAQLARDRDLFLHPIKIRHFPCKASMNPTLFFALVFSALLGRALAGQGGWTLKFEVPACLANVITSARMHNCCREITARVVVRSECTCFDSHSRLFQDNFDGNTIDTSKWNVANVSYFVSFSRSFPVSLCYHFSRFTFFFLILNPFLLFSRITFTRVTRSLASTSQTKYTCRMGIS